MDWLLLVGARQGKDLRPEAAKEGEAEPEEEGPAFTKEFPKCLQREVNWHLVEEVRAGPTFEEVEVRYLVLKQHLVQIRQMNLKYCIQHLAVERHTWQSSLVELPHIIILDQADRDPEGTDFITGVVQDTGHQLAQILLGRDPGSVLGLVPHVRRAEVDSLVVDSVGRYDIKEAVGEQFPQVNALNFFLIPFILVSALVHL